jgi:hypothetical protein
VGAGVGERIGEEEEAVLLCVGVEDEEDEVEEEDDADEEESVGEEETDGALGV